MKSLRISVIGPGAVGSFMTDVLARMGATISGVVDADLVEGKNLPKSVYRRSHIGESKCSALAKHIEDISGSSPSCFQKFAQDLSNEEWSSLLDSSDMLLDCCDSRSGTSVVITKTMEHFLSTGRDTPVIKAFCLDNLAAGISIFWTPASDHHCPVCFLNSVAYLNSCDERAGSTDEDYLFERITGTPVRGVIPDLLYGISFTASLVQAVGKCMLGENAGRDNLLGLLEQSNFFIWSPFRDPYLSWQTSPTMMGKVEPLDFSTPSPCPACGKNMVTSDAIGTNETAPAVPPRLMSLRDACIG